MWATPDAECLPSFLEGKPISSRVSGVRSASLAVILPSPHGSPFVFFFWIHSFQNSSAFEDGNKDVVAAHSLRTPESAGVCADESLVDFKHGIICK